MSSLEGVVLADGATTVDGRTAAIRCYDWADVWRVGPSRGFNRVLPGQPGAAARNHVRGELDVTLSWRCHGAYTVGGAHVPDGARSRLLDHLDMVRSLVDGAEGRQLALVYYDPDGNSSTGAATFRAMGRPVSRSPLIVEFDMLLTLPSGLLPRPTPGSPT